MTLLNFKKEKKTAFKTRLLLLKKKGSSEILSCLKFISFTMNDIYIIKNILLLKKYEAI